MARIPLQQPTWEYDDSANRLIVRFVSAPPVDHEDPVNYEPEFTYEVSLPLPQGGPKVERRASREVIRDR